MVKKNNASMDGFVPRRSIGGRRDVAKESGLTPSFKNSNLSHARDDRELKGSALAPQNEGGLSRDVIDASLNEIQPIDEQPKTKRHQRRKPLTKKKLIGRILLAILAVILIAGAYVGAKLLMAGGSVFKGNVLGLIQSQPLKQDENGRTNILLFGTSEDDEGGNHPGAWLTDSIMIISLDQENNNAYTFSIPRDLWVKYNRACAAGYEGRINALYQCYSDQGADETAGTDAMRTAIKTATGLEVQYYAHVNYGVVVDVVDAVGGVDVDIQGDGPVPAGVEPGSVLDRNFDWKCNHQCYMVKYAPGVHHLDGEHALALARARGDAVPTYGFARSNYDREINQQKIAIALKEKALSAGTLTNIGTVTTLLDALGKNLRTNFDTAEIRTLMRLASDIPAESITSLSLIDATPAVFVGDSVSGASIVRSSSGFYDFTNLKKYLSKEMSSDPVVRESAGIAVYNGTSTYGLAQQTADGLEDKGYKIAAVRNADNTSYKGYALYDVSGGAKPQTLAKLEAEYGVKALSGEPSFTVASDVDIVLVVGQSE